MFGTYTCFVHTLVNRDVVKVTFTSKGFTSIPYAEGEFYKKKLLIRQDAREESKKLVKYANKT